MFTMLMIDGRLVLVTIPSDAIEVDPDLVRKLHTDEGQRTHCAACPLISICVTHNQFQIERARVN